MVMDGLPLARPGWPRYKRIHLIIIPPSFFPDDPRGSVRVRRLNQESQLTEVELAHFDEIGMWGAGKLHWMHVAFTERLMLLFAHDKRGGEALHSEARF